MRESPRISDVRFTPAPHQWHARGLLGWVSAVIDNALGVGGIAVRRTTDGRITLSFPGHKDRDGEVHHHVWPRDDATRLAIESQVIEHLRERGALS